jgi:hypothetical protein
VVIVWISYLAMNLIACFPHDFKLLSALFRMMVNLLQIFLTLNWEKKSLQSWRLKSQLSFTVKQKRIERSKVSLESLTSQRSRWGKRKKEIKQEQEQPYLNCKQQAANHFSTVCFFVLCFFQSGIFIAFERFE